MGCDIHIHVEYRHKKARYWTSLYYDSINPGRIYELFTKLSAVRGDNAHPIATPGWPDNPSFSSENAIKVRIDDENSNCERRVSSATAQRWVSSNSSRYIFRDGTDIPIAVTHPDWHSYGHCTVEQMAKALRGNSGCEYRAMMAAARSLEKDGLEVRFLFYYDN